MPLLTAWPTEYWDLQLSLLSDHIHDILPPSGSALGNSFAVVLLDQELARAWRFHIVDYTSIDASAEVLEEARVDQVGDWWLIRMHQSFWVEVDHSFLQ